MLKPQTPIGCRFLPALLLPLLVCAPGTASAAEPLHQRVDACILAHAGGPVAAPASDAEFIRRAALDLNGVIPMAAETVEFLRDAAPDKRRRLVDRLLERPEYARRMREAFSVFLLERRNKDDASTTAWNDYLESSFRSNKPIDRLIHEILAPDPENEATRASALFFTKRLESFGQNPVDFPMLTRDIGRLFLGLDLKCAQCHDHLSVKEYKQADYQGLYAFVGHAFIRTDVPFPAVGESPVRKKVEFASVFSGKRRETGPRLPGDAEVEIPSWKSDEEFAVPPDKSKGFPGRPRFSPLGALAERMTRPDNAAFARNMANRLWFLVMGRGLVHPLDLGHAANPPSDPELLDILAAELRAMKFDTRAFLRELVLTECYSRTSLLSPGEKPPPPESYRVAILKRLSPEQLARSFLRATEEPEAMEEGRTASRKDILKKFVAAFGSPPGEPEVEFAPTVAGALFLSNDGFTVDSLGPRPGSLIDRLSKLTPESDIADELYLTILSRSPTAEERAEVAGHLMRRSGSRSTAISELAWALLASTEFVLNH